MELVRRVYENLKADKKMYRKIAVLVEFMVIVFMVLTQYEYWLTRPTYDMEKAQNAEYNLRIRVNELQDGQYEQLVYTTKFDEVKNSSIIKETSLEIADTRYTEEFRQWSGYDDGHKDYIDIYAIGRDQYDKYIKELGLSYDDIKDKAILCEYSDVIGYKKTPLTKDDERTKSIKMHDYDIGDLIKGTITNGGRLSSDYVYEFEVGVITKQNPFGLKNENGVKIILSDELFDQYIDAKVANVYYEATNAYNLQNDIDTYLRFDYTTYNLEETYDYYKGIFNIVSLTIYSLISVITLIPLILIFVVTNEYAKKNSISVKTGGTEDIFKNKLFECLLLSVKILIGAYLTSTILNGITNVAIHTPAGVLLIFIPLMVLALYIPVRMVVAGVIPFLIKVVVELPIAIWLTYITSVYGVFLPHQIIVPILEVFGIMTLVAVVYTKKFKEYVPKSE